MGGEKEPQRRLPRGDSIQLDWDGEAVPYFAFSSELKVIVDPDTGCVC